MTPTRISLAAAGAAVIVLLVIGLSQLGGSSASTAPSKLTLAQMQARLSGSPAPLVALHAQGDEILPGGLAAVRTRLASLRGRPIVVNKWASWCVPCKAEFGAFQSASLTRGRQVAFIGIDSEDDSASAAGFLRSFPVSYPSYFDPSGQAGVAITDSSSTPVTVFYNARGSQYIHQGPYLSASKLEADIARYALNG